MKKISTIGTILFSLFICSIINTPVFAGSDIALWLRYPSISPDGETVAFSYQGDLYTVPAEGGAAIPLTRHLAYDFKPVWSNDGKTIAFASDRYGNFDIFVIPAVGGTAKRLTYYSAGDIPHTFSPDGKFIYFHSSRKDSPQSPLFPSGVLPELYKVALDGTKPVQVLTSPALNTDISKNGNIFLYQDEKSYENIWRKHDNSSFTRDVWMYNTGTGKHTMLTDEGVDDRNPRWGPDEKWIYYLSESSGSFNVWKMERNNHKLRKQVTHHTKHPVRFLTISDKGDLCYGFNGELYIRKPGAADSEKLSITITGDEPRNRDEFLSIRSGAREMAVSPNGKEVAFVARGEVFVTSVDHATTKQITHTPQQERSISFSPDGKKLLFAAEMGSSWDLYTASITRKDEPYFFSSTLLNVAPLLKSDKETFQPAFSPDGKEVAFLEERVTLKVINLKTKKVREVLSADKNYSYTDGDQWYQWAPDSQWLLVSFMDRGRWMGEVGLVHASGAKEVINLTNSGYWDFAPKWGMKGKVVYWASDRHGMRSHGSWGSQNDVYGLFLTRDGFDRFNLSKEEFELLKEKEKKAKKAKKDDKAKKKDKKVEKKPELLTFDLKNIEDRKVRMTIHSSALSDFALTPDGEKLYYLARFEKGYDLWMHEFREKKTKLAAKLGARGGALEFSKDGKTLFVLASGSISKITVSNGKRKPVTFSTEMKLRTHKEREYIFEHTWRQIYKKFYKKDMHGVDWNFYKKEYARFLPHISNNWDFAEMLSEMLGELNASHTGSGYRARHKNPDSTAALGLFFDPAYKGDGLKVLEVIAKGPLDNSESFVKKGTIIKKINGVLIKAGMNHYPLLNRKAGKRTLLTLMNPGTGKEWEEVMKPITRRQLSSLFYQRWVKTRRDATDKLSNGRLGYIHVRSMNSSSFRVVYSEALGRFADREGLVIDTRFNGGGNLHDDLANFLNGKKYLTYMPRGQKIGEQPIRRWIRKSIVVMDEGNYSDAHMFPYAYRALGVGKLVGMPVPGTGTSVWWETLQDPSLYFGMPQIGYLTNDGKFLENTQVEPDIKVDNDPESVAIGVDKQLETAIKALLKDIDKAKKK